jgi:hypothetical protein
MYRPSGTGSSERVVVTTRGGRDAVESGAGFALLRIPCAKATEPPATIIMASATERPDLAATDRFFSCTRISPRIEMVVDVYTFPTCDAFDNPSRKGFVR